VYAEEFAPLSELDTQQALATGRAKASRVPVTGAVALPHEAAPSGVPCVSDGRLPYAASDPVYD
jgi:hypothetical protein